ncbi:unnamed protein product [Schistocephalus solidus]|uniref:IstB_IS21 domain-containing protein n=1 Tax=Schistocephalus solidus TaxID=70667 RepID=A0A183SX06_SCHSO|nr:unnamed protein product [Schistocephalus solidus]
MQTLRGELHIDGKLFKMFLERLTTDAQIILAFVLEDLSVSWLGEVADRMLEVQRLQPPSIAQLSSSSYRHLMRTLRRRWRPRRTRGLCLSSGFRTSPPADHPVAHPAVIGLTRNLKLLMSVSYQFWAQRPIGAIPPVL